tara:strand:- start:546 stop:1094 length:549 start_codon:yes stop_codon:yes gene_type:complete
LHNFVVIEDIVNSYSYEDLTVLSGSFSHINPTIDSVLLKTLNNINVLSILRYGFLLLINVVPFIYFIKIKNKYENRYFNYKNICLILLLLSIPLYLLIFDWGRVIYINHNFLVIIIILIFNLDLVDKDYIKKKLQSLNRHIKVFAFILVCLLFSPKLLVTDDLGSKPLYKSATKIFKIIKNF